MLSAWSQQAPRLLISSLLRPGEEQTAADKSPRGATKGGGLLGRQSTCTEVSSAVHLRSLGWERSLLAEAIPGGFKEEAALTLDFEGCVGFRSIWQETQQGIQLKQRKGSVKAAGISLRDVYIRVPVQLCDLE